MQITNLSLRNFRNIKSQELKFSEHLNLFLGQNAQGKSNLLEAICLLCRGQSFRPSKNIHFIHKDIHIDNENAAAILRANAKDQNLDFQFLIQIQNAKKNFLLNDKKISSESLAEKLSCVVFSPESLNAIKNSSGDRRELIDEMLFNNSKQERQKIAFYNKCLMSRNKLLKSIKESSSPSRQQIMTLEALDESFLKAAAELAFARIEALHKIKAELQKNFNEISNTQSLVDISMEYVISDQIANTWTYQQCFDFMQKRLADLRFREMQFGSSLVGPHKHDINFLYAGNDSRYYCSQGQQRALILAFKIAQIVYHRNTQNRWPILILDDVLSELDGEKQKKLIEFLMNCQAQTFVSSTDVFFQQTLEAKNASMAKFFVENGTFAKEGYSVGAKPTEFARSDKSI